MLQRLPSKDRFWLLLGLIILLGGLASFSLAITGQAIYEWVIWGFLQVTGEVTEATVVKKTIVEGEGVEYYVEYEFRIEQTGEETRRQKKKEHVSKDTYTQVDKGSSLPVRFNQRIPSIARIENQDYDRNFKSTASCWWNVCLSLFLVLIVILIRPIQSTLTKRRLTSGIAGALVMLAVTMIGWIIEFILVSMELVILPITGGVISLGLGMLAGLVAAGIIWVRLESYSGFPFS